MHHSPTGQFYGQTNKTLHLGGLTLTDTEYTLPKVDWHYHENAYFTFLIEGRVIEGNKKEVYDCPAGTLLFHHWQDPHYNIKPEGYTRGFHVEMDKQWFDRFFPDAHRLQGSLNIKHPDLKLLMYRIFRESKRQDRTSNLSIESLLTETLSKLQQIETKSASKKPQWVPVIDEILHEQLTDDFSLEQLAKLCQIHPVHLSKDFPKYFGCNLGAYIRKLRVQKALELMPSQNSSLTEIAHQCGFYDQSHFIRSFKSFNGNNPADYRKVLLQRSKR
ncbi:helix-turn-helix domain-containing protein [Flavobacterium sp.]|uniref:helix-turn-helix domain-containing protein n=1 Tax=Flavobacterium sp. TaxID=239 RepID=UPI0039E5FC2A